MARSCSGRVARRTLPIMLFLSGMMFADPPIADAHYLSHDDANDASSRLDLRRVSLRLHRDVHRIVLTARTYQRFKLKRDGYIYWDLDSYGDSRRDYTVKLFYDTGHLGIVCYPIPRHTHQRPSAVGRPDDDFDVGPRLARCQIRSREIRRSGHMRWHVRTTKFDRFVFDTAPDGGAWFAH
jgi:hypothetical protein